MIFRTIIKIFLFLFVTLLYFPIMGYNQGAEYFNTQAWELLSEEEKLTNINEWIEKAQDNRRWSYNARYDFAESAYHFAVQMQNEELKMKAGWVLAVLIFDAGEFDLALNYFDTVAKLAEKRADQELLIRIQNYSGSIHRYRGEVFEALGITYDAYQRSRDLEMKNMQALSANNLGIIYRYLGENKLAHQFYSESLEYSVAASDTLQMIIAYGGLGNYYWFEKEVDMAFNYYQTAMGLARIIRDQYQIAQLNNNLGNIYRERQDFEKALEYYSQAESLLVELNVSGLSAINLRNQGLVWKMQQDYPKAIRLFERSLEISQRLDVKPFISDNYLALSECYKSMGDLEKAYDYLTEHNQVERELSNSLLLNRISYYNEKISDAQRQEELYRFRLQRNFFILIIALLVLVFLTLFSILIFRRFKDRRRHVDRLKGALQDKIITEKALRQSEENYQTLLKALNEGLILLDKQNKIEFINQRAAKVLGSDDRNEIIGKYFESFLLSYDDEKLFHEKIELHKMGMSDQYEIKLKSLTDDVLWVNMSSAPILDENLKAKGVVSMITNVTEKKKSEQTYGELTANLNQKIKQLNCLYDITDISGVPGITFEEIIEKSLEIIPVGLRYSHDIGVQIFFNNKSYTSSNFVDTEWSYSVPIKSQKKKLGFIKVAYAEEKPNSSREMFHFNEKILLKNISEKFGQIIESKTLEKTLRENQEKLEEVQRIAKIGNWQKDMATGLCEFSETFFDIADIAPERRKFFDYTRFIELIHPDDKEVFMMFEKRLLNPDNGGYATTNYRIITNEGFIKYIFSSGKPLRDEDGKEVTGFVFTVQDITEQKYTQELQHHAEVALKTSEAKQQVLANMSYEMRTPITGIMGMTDFLLESGLNDSQMELAKTIKDSSIGLLNMINNILDLQRIEAGKFRLNNTVFDLSQLLDKIQSLFTALTRNREIHLFIEKDPEIPDHIISDQARLYQVITSLMSIVTENAGLGNITIRLKKENLVSNKMLIMVELVDDFSSIDIDEVNTIFKSVQEQDDYFVEKRDNISVGLAISMKLVDMLEGSIGIEKNENGGTTFFFTFFTTIAQNGKTYHTADNSPEKLMAGLVGVRVLCVEDQKINQKVINLMLSHANCRLQIASNGKEALELIKKNSFDVILLDMVMPVMDGVETLNVLKKKFKNYPPVIALSANVLDEDKDRYFAAGVNDFISKPINAAELYQKIEKWSTIFRNSQTVEWKKPPMKN